jgi:hypothetical protein
MPAKLNAECVFIPPLRFVSLTKYKIARVRVPTHLNFNKQVMRGDTHHGVSIFMQRDSFPTGLLPSSIDSCTTNDFRRDPSYFNSELRNPTGPL